MKVGDRVIIKDYSDAHNNKGVVWHIQDNGILWVELDPVPDDGVEEGWSTLWFVNSESELEAEHE